MCGSDVDGMVERESLKFDLARRKFVQLTQQVCSKSSKIFHQSSAPKPPNPHLPPSHLYSFLAIAIPFNDITSFLSTPAFRVYICAVTRNFNSLEIFYKLFIRDRTCFNWSSCILSNETPKKCELKRKTLLRINELVKMRLSG